MKKLLLKFVVLASALLLSSCFATRTAIGNFHEQVRVKEDVRVYSRAKQFYLIGGLIPLGRKQVAVPNEGAFQVRTKLNFVDGLVTVVTFGILNMSTIQVVVPINSMYPNAAYPNASPAAYQNPASAAVVPTAE